MHARPIATLVLGLALGFGLPACIENDVSIRLESACFPPTPNKEGGCSYPPQCDTVLLGNPTVDVAYVSVVPQAWNGTLEWPIQVGNQMVADGARSGGANSKDAWIEKYVISYTGPVAIPSVTVPITRHLVPASGKSVVIMPVVTPANRAAFAAAVTGVPLQFSAELVAKGHLADGSAFETGPFTMVFTVCEGCYVDPDPIFLCNKGDPLGTIPWIGSCPQPGQSSVPGCGG